MGFFVQKPGEKRRNERPRAWVYDIVTDLDVTKGRGQLRVVVLTLSDFTF